VRASLSLLRLEPRARWFFAVLAQSSLGTGAAHVALLLIAYQRFHSPWAVSLVLLADVVPPMLFGPILGAAADRWPRRLCAVVADVLRAVAFLGIALVDPFVSTVALALVAGIGNALFKPAVLSGLPTLVAPERAAAATALYGAMTDFGYTVGPALTAGALLVIDPEGVMLANSLTFACSALILARLAWGEAVAVDEDETRESLLHETRLGLRAAAQIPGIQIVIAASAGTMFMVGLFNVAEPLFARITLGSSDSGFALLVTVFGLGFIAGSLRGGEGGVASVLRRRYLQGLFVMSVGFVASGAAPGLGLALLTFTLAGFGNGLLLVHERLLIQNVVPDRLQGRIFAVSDTAVSWAFGVSFLCAGPLLSAIGVRATILLAGGAGIVVAALAAYGLRGHWRTMVRPNLGQARPRPVAADEDQASLPAPSRSRS
jgi:MFS family permease